MLTGKRALWLLPLLIFVAHAVNLAAPFSTHGEAREAVVVKNMLEQENYILPLRNNTEIPSKPPLFHWGGLLASKLSGGLSEFNIRLPSAVFAFLALVALGAAVSRRDSQPAAILSIFICATAFEWFRSSELARVDMVFAACVSIALWELYEMVNGERSPLRYLFILILLVGATLAKGPAGLIIPLAIIGLYLLPRLLRRELPFNLVFSLGSLAVLAAVVAGQWYAAAYLQQGDAFLDTQLLKENVARLAGTPGYEVGHEKPFYFAPIELLLAFLPWSLALPLVIRDLWRNRKELPREGGLRWLAVCATAVFLLVCAVAVSKRPVYFLPLLPLLSYLTAVEMMRLEWRRKLVWRFGAAIVGLLFIAGVTGISAKLRSLNSPAPFLKQLQSKVPAGSPLVQLGKDFFPLLYYFPGNIPVVPASADIPAGGFGITSERNLELCAECEVVARSENKPDNGKSALILVRHR